MEDLQELAALLANARGDIQGALGKLKEAYALAKKIYGKDFPLTGYCDNAHWNAETVERNIADAQSLVPMLRLP